MLRGWTISGRSLAMVALASSATALAQDPFGAAPGEAPATAGPSTSAAADAIASCVEISEALCLSANNTFLYMVAGYISVCLAACVIWTILWSGRGAGRGLLKFGLPLLVGATVAALAVGFDPFASENYLCCIGNPTFRVALLLGESRVARALVVGLIPFSVLYVVLVYVIKAARS